MAVAVVLSMPFCASSCLMRPCPHLLFWARAELGSLHQWLEFVATATNCQEVTPSEFASMVTDKLEPLLRGFDAALEDGRA